MRARVFIGGLICENGGKLIKDLRSTLGPRSSCSCPTGSRRSRLWRRVRVRPPTARTSASPVSRTRSSRAAGKAFLVAFTKSLQGRAAGPVLGVRRRRPRS